MADPITFDYDRAFSRNIGWVTQTEQAQVKIDGCCAVGEFSWQKC